MKEPKKLVYPSDLKDKEKDYTSNYNPFDDIKCEGSSCDMYKPKYGSIFHSANNLRKALKRLEM